MKYRKVINEPIEVDEDGVHIVGGVNAVISANVNEPGGKSHASSKQKIRVVQRKGRPPEDPGGPSSRKTAERP
jgi:hypothetical protein